MNKIHGIYKQQNIMQQWKELFSFTSTHIIDETHKCNVKWKKTNTKGTYDFMYVKIKSGRQNESIDIKIMTVTLERGGR